MTRETKGQLRNMLNTAVDSGANLQRRLTEMQSRLEAEASARVSAEAAVRQLRWASMQEGQKWQAARSRMEAVITHLVGVIGSPDSMVRIDPVKPPQGYNVVMTDGISRQAAQELGRIGASGVVKTPLKAFP